MSRQNGSPNWCGKSTCRCIRIFDKLHFRQTAATRIFAALCSTTVRVSLGKTCHPSDSQAERTRSTSARSGSDGSAPRRDAKTQAAPRGHSIRGCGRGLLISAEIWLRRSRVHTSGLRRGRREGGGLEGIGARHPPQRQARRPCRAGPADGSAEGPVDLGGFHAIVANPIDGSVWGTVGVLAKTLLWPQITARAV